MREPTASEETTELTAESLPLLIESAEDYAMFLLDIKGRIVTWNRGAQRIKGYTASEIIGRHFSVFYPPEDASKPEAELRIAAREGRVEDEGWRLRKDGSRFWANVVITALRDEKGRLKGFGKVTRDLTDRRAVVEALRRSEERFRMLIDGIADYAVYMLDPTGHVSTWNSGAEQIKVTRRARSLAATTPRFLPPKTSRPANQKPNWRARRPKVGTRKRPIGFARTAPASGPMSY